MAETPRTQVEEPRFGVSIQPAADPVDRTIIARAPQITADPYMNAWSEIARDFAAGYGALKKAQVEADIPMGEQYYLESGVDGLFADGKDEQAAMAALVRNGELAEEHSIGTRIGFERASGRSAAYREREKLSATLTEMISGARELDPQTGLPKLATAQDIDDAIARIRGESYAKYTQDPNFAWFKNSPYAAEEYNKLMRTYTPELAAQFKEKARENLTEHRRAMLMDELVNQAANLGTKQTITMDEFNNLNDFVFNNVIIGGIPNPQQFMAQAFQVAGLKMMNENPQADHVGLMEQFIDRVNAYRDPKTGTKIQGLFWEKTKDSLRTEARQREAQAGVDRRKSIDSSVKAEYAKGEDPNSFVAKALTIVKSSREPGANRDLALSQLQRLQSEAVTQALQSPDKSAGAFATDVFERLGTDFANIINGDIKADKNQDDAAKSIALAVGLNGDYEKAQNVAERILDPSVKIATMKSIVEMQDAKINIFMKDPVVASKMQTFRSTKKIVAQGVASAAESRPARAPRSAIGNQTLDAEMERNWLEDNTTLMENISAIVSDKGITVAEKKSRISSAIEEVTARRREILSAINKRFFELEQQIASNESKYQPSVPAIEDAYDSGIIDADSRDKLIKGETTLQQRVTPDLKIFEEQVRLAWEGAATPVLQDAKAIQDEKNKFYKDNFEEKYYVTPSGGRTRSWVLSASGKAEVAAIAQVMADRWRQAYAEGKIEAYSNVFGVKMLTDPKILRQATSDYAINEKIRQTARKVIELRAAGKEIPQL